MGVWMGGWPQSAFTTFWAFFEHGSQHHTKKWGWHSAFTIANLAIKVSIHTKNRVDSQHTKKIEPPNSAYFQRKNKLRKLHRGLRLCPPLFAAWRSTFSNLALATVRYKYIQTCTPITYADIHWVDTLLVSTHIYFFRFKILHIRVPVGPMITILKDLGN